MARFSFRIRSGAPRGLVGRLFTSLFFLVFLVAGLVVTYALLVETWHNLKTHGWPQTTCTVVSSSVTEDPGNDHYEFSVTYRYRAGGGSHTGYVYRPGYTGSDDSGEAYGLANRYPADAEVPCRVNPDDPADSTLEPGNPWSALLVFLPLIFVAVGGGGLWFLWRRRSGAPAPVTARDVDPKKGVGFGLAFCGVFAAAGLALFIPFFALPALQALEARSWTPVPATIEHSAVRSHPGDDSTTYSVDVRYRYTFGGAEYVSNRYDFVTGSSSGYDGKAEIVAGLPEGSETTALVDPDEPWEAVLSNDFRGEWLFGLLPLVFVFAGVGGMALVLRGASRLQRREARGVEEWMPEPAGELEAAGGPLVLEPKTSPVGKLVSVTFFALVWNGIVGVFVWLWWHEYRSNGVPDGCLTLFLIPFVLIGLVLLLGVPHQLLALFNPRPVLTLDRRRLTPGSEANLGWRFKGRAGRIRRLTITLVGEEKASYTRGTDRRTDTHVFHQETLVDTGVEVTGGNAPLTVPADTMHSFEASNNEIVWTLKLHGVIDRWPDVRNEMPLTIRPQEDEG